jgi:hypothetical protein
MSGRSADINPRMFAVVDECVEPRQVSNKTLVSSFAISCTHCLWDVVGSFLGRRVKSQGARPARLCEEVAVVLI